MILWWLGNALLAFVALPIVVQLEGDPHASRRPDHHRPRLASCVAVIAVHLWQTSVALAEVDARLAQLPGALAGMEPAMDTINGSLARVAAGDAPPVTVSS